MLPEISILAAIETNVVSHTCFSFGQGNRELAEESIVIWTLI